MASRHRLHSLCPYFAMFPESFARDAIKKTTKRGDLILDPFCGRGTTILEALLNGRHAIGCDINPVAAVVSRAKANPPKLQEVLDRLDELRAKFDKAGKQKLFQAHRNLPPFFRQAYSRSTLIQLLYLQKFLPFARSRADRFLCALLLGHLHGECYATPSYLSNQMPHTIAPKPDYAVRFWRDRELTPPNRDVFALLRSKAEFRFKDEPPKLFGKVMKCDVRVAASKFHKENLGKVRAVITSPPYLDVTNYEEDQWLRLWFLTGTPRPTYNTISSDDRITTAERYFQFLVEAWTGIAPLLKADARMVCRIGAKKISANELAHKFDWSVKQVWPKARRTKKPVETELKNRQTNAFRPGSVGCKYEYDFHYVLSA